MNYSKIIVTYISKVLMTCELYIRSFQQL